MSILEPWNANCMISHETSTSKSLHLLAWISVSLVPWDPAGCRESVSNVVVTRFCCHRIFLNTKMILHIFDVKKARAIHVDPLLLHKEIAYHWLVRVSITGRDVDVVTSLCSPAYLRACRSSKWSAPTIRRNSCSTRWREPSLSKEMMKLHGTSSQGEKSSKTKLRVPRVLRVLG